jgi:hypothetical protein
MAVADHSMVRWVSRRAECSVISEEITASILRAIGSGSRGWFTWMHRREPKFVTLKVESARSSETSEHFTTRRRNPKKTINDLATHFRFAQLLSLGEGWEEICLRMHDDCSALKLRESTFLCSAVRYANGIALC